MNDSNDTLLISATIEIPAAALEAIVDNAKKKAGPDASGVFRVDTAEAVNELITKFLGARDFMDFVSDPKNY